MDKDGGGSLSADEVKQLMELLGMKLKQDDVDQMIAEIDADGSGQIDFEEFLEVRVWPPGAHHVTTTPPWPWL